MVGPLIVNRLLHVVALAGGEPTLLQVLIVPFDIRVASTRSTLLLIMMLPVAMMIRFGSSARLPTGELFSVMLPLIFMLPLTVSLMGLLMVISPFRFRLPLHLYSLELMAAINALFKALQLGAPVTGPTGLADPDPCPPKPPFFAGDDLYA